MSAVLESGTVVEQAERASFRDQPASSEGLRMPGGFISTSSPPSQPVRAFSREARSSAPGAGRRRDSPGDKDQGLRLTAPKLPPMSFPPAAAMGSQPRAEQRNSEGPYHYESSQETNDDGVAQRRLAITRWMKASEIGSQSIASETAAAKTLPQSAYLREEGPSSPVPDSRCYNPDPHFVPLFDAIEKLVAHQEETKIIPVTSEAPTQIPVKVDRSPLGAKMQGWRSVDAMASSDDDVMKHAGQSQTAMLTSDSESEESDDGFEIIPSNSPSSLNRSTVTQYPPPLSTSYIARPSMTARLSSTNATLKADRARMEAEVLRLNTTLEAANKRAEKLEADAVRSRELSMKIMREAHRTRSALAAHASDQSPAQPQPPAHRANHPRPPLPLPPSASQRSEVSRHDAHLARSPFFSTSTTAWDPILGPPPSSPAPSQLDLDLSQQVKDLTGQLSALRRDRDLQRVQIERYRESWRKIKEHDRNKNQSVDSRDLTEKAWQPKA